MLEQLLITAVLGAAAGGYLIYCWLTKSSAPQSPTAVPPTPRKATASGATAPAPGGPSISVPGALRLPPRAEKPILSHYGLRNLPFYDFCLLPGPLTKEALPPVVATTLDQLYVQGDALGPALMEFICHQRSLKEGEALYFALVGHSYQAPPRLVTFVDKFRSFPAVS